MVKERVGEGMFPGMVRHIREQEMLADQLRTNV